MTGPERPRPPDDDALDALVARCLERMEEEGPAAVEAVCREHPEVADSLRRRLARLGELGVLVPSSGTSPATPERLGPYRLTELIGSGGMGVVYRARDEALGRDVALKVVRPEHLFVPGARERFRREVETIARLRHPGIVTVHAVGEEGGVPWFAMELVDGASLADVTAALRGEGARVAASPRRDGLAGGRPETSPVGEPGRPRPGATGSGRSAGRRAGTLRGADLARAVCAVRGVDAPESAEGWLFAGSWEDACLRVVRQVAEALGYAHGQGLVHRDVKPGNVMVTAGGEGGGGARVLLMDFGLVTGGGGGRRLTRTGAYLGSLPYMAPEQMRGDSDAVGPVTDVYGLGVTLYELLTLRPAFDAASDADLAHAIRQGAKPRPRSLNPALSWEAETVCLTAMDPDPSRRYASAADMARDLGAVLARRPIEARRAGPWLAARRWARANPARAVAAALALLLVVGGPSVVALMTSAANERIASEAEAAQRARERADREAGRAREQAQLAESRRRLAVQREEDAMAARAEAEAERAAAVAARAEAEAQRELAERRAEELLRLSAQRDVDRLVEEADALWPARPERERAMEAWIAEAQALLAELDGFRATRDRLRARADAVLPPREPDPSRGGLDAELDLKRRTITVFEDWRDDVGGARSSAVGDDPELLAQSAVLEDDVEILLETLPAEVALLEDRLGLRTRYVFDDRADQWWHDQLDALVRALEMLGDPVAGLLDGLTLEHGPGVRRRLSMARELSERTMTGDVARRRWDEAVAAIATHPAYGGLELTPQFGLLPLGPDPGSGLWEFAHLATGPAPTRDGHGEMTVGSEHGVVLVLVPGGTFLMGAQADDPDAPNHDPLASPSESPVHEVTLDPFFMGKHELTQGQWHRMTATTPSYYGISFHVAGHQHTLAHPVESITWSEAMTVLPRVGLTLPTEARWESAARAGTSTPWWSGADRASLAGRVNLADRAAAEQGVHWPAIDEQPDYVDGWALHAAVGRFPANPFGLHDVMGNVTELCLDEKVDYELPVSPGDGLRVRTVGGGGLRSGRGGGFHVSYRGARIAVRYDYQPDVRLQYVGLRVARDVER